MLLYHRRTPVPTHWPDPSDVRLRHVELPRIHDQLSPMHDPIQTLRRDPVHHAVDEPATALPERSPCGSTAPTGNSSTGAALYNESSLDLLPPSRPRSHRAPLSRATTARASPPPH
ncbi:uncharacterized protein M6B38_132010 [Iris pallida]|uniref:Uncharacterized protein n=1 Tax=Iris pallida TaxID=29817 RepID=A0AAX6FRT6_IRIPA|nr:uncharacterized protein M6B38_132010 [Iris pallida]